MGIWNGEKKGKIPSKFDEIRVCQGELKAESAFEQGERKSVRYGNKNENTNEQ